MQGKNNPKTSFLASLALVTACAETGLWLISEWTGFFVTTLLILLCISILLISRIAEMLERSNIPSWFFPALGTLLAVSVAVMAFYGLINGFRFDWQVPAH